MEKVTINLAGATSKDAIQDILVSSLQLPDYYGRNLDALYDCVSTMYLKKRLEITICGMGEVTEELQGYVGGIAKVLTRAASESVQISDSTFIMVNIH